MYETINNRKILIRTTTQCMFVLFKFSYLNCIYAYDAPHTCYHRQTISNLCPTIQSSIRLNSNSIQIQLKPLLHFVLLPFAFASLFMALEYQRERKKNIKIIFLHISMCALLYQNNSVFTFAHKFKNGHAVLGIQIKSIEIIFTIQ